jgi:hypothetical protein
MDQEQERAVRLVISTAEAKIITDTSVHDVCSRCGREVWVDSAQQFPVPLELIDNVCIDCGMEDAEIRPMVLETYELAKAAHLWAEG